MKDERNGREARTETVYFLLAFFLVLDFLAAGDFFVLDFFVEDFLVEDFLLEDFFEAGLFFEEDFLLEDFFEAGLFLVEGLFLDELDFLLLLFLDDGDFFELRGDLATEGEREREREREGDLAAPAFLLAVDLRFLDATDFLDEGDFLAEGLFEAEGEPFFTTRNVFAWPAAVASTPDSTPGRVRTQKTARKEKEI
jgi:hypothetical protein